MWKLQRSLAHYEGVLLCDHACSSLKQVNCNLAIIFLEAKGVLQVNCNLAIIFLEAKGVFSWWKSLDFGIVVYFVVTW